MSGADDKIFAEAASWHLASGDEGMDWDAFASWLEADPRHRAAFGEIAQTDALLVEHGPELGEAFGTSPDSEVYNARPIRWPGQAKAWLGGAIAASLVAVIAVYQFAGPAKAVYETDAKSRLVALADGSSIDLAPHSRLEIAGSSQEQMTLDGGAWFDIRHNPARQLSIRAGGVEISDIGTQFDVQTAGEQVRIEVGQGEVSVASKALSHPVRLAQDRGLTFDPAGGTATVKPLANANVGEWRSGRLSFDAAPLPLVAADLSRYAGVKVTVAENLAGRHFTGTLVIGDGEAALRDLSQLMDLDLRRDGNAYVLESRSH